jgi:hypothetical protein
MAGIGGQIPYDARFDLQTLGEWQRPLALIQGNTQQGEARIAMKERQVEEFGQHRLAIKELLKSAG